MKQKQNKKEYSFRITLIANKNKIDKQYIILLLLLLLFKTKFIKLAEAKKIRFFLIIFGLKIN